MLTASNYQAAGIWDLSDLVMLGSIDWTGKLCKIGEKWDDLVARAPLLIDKVEAAVEKYLHLKTRCFQFVQFWYCDLTTRKRQLVYRLNNSWEKNRSERFDLMSLKWARFSSEYHRNLKLKMTVFIFLFKISHNKAILQQLKISHCSTYWNNTEEYPGCVSTLWHHCGSQSKSGLIWGENTHLARLSNLKAGGTFFSVHNNIRAYCIWCGLWDFKAFISGWSTIEYMHVPITTWLNNQSIISDGCGPKVCI